MRKLLLLALGVAVGTAVAVALSAREQLDAPTVAPLAPEPAPGTAGLAFGANDPSAPAE